VNILNQYRPNPTRQRGSVLAVSLMMLVMLTILGLTVTRTAVTEQKIAQNQRAKELAFAAAESALRDAEHWIDQQRLYPQEKVCTTPACNLIAVISSADEKFNQDQDYLGLNTSSWLKHGRLLHTQIKGEALQLSGLAEQPRYIIREARFMPDTLTRGLEAQPGRYLYEVTGWGTGTETFVEVVLQSTFIRRY